MEHISICILKEEFDMDIMTKLNTEIETLTKALEGMTPGTDPHKAAIDELTKLMDRAIKLQELENEQKNKELIREDDKALKLEQAKEDKKDRLIKNIIAAAGIVLPLGVTIWGTRTSLKFEEEGTVTTILGRGFINKLIPKK
jgi:hypothetical protein